MINDYETKTMKQVIYPLASLFLALSCGGGVGKTIDSEPSVQRVREIKTAKTRSDIYIEDQSRYSPSFIKGLAAYDGTISLVDNYIVTDHDTTLFPEITPLNQPVVFKATNVKYNYTLTITRTNLTNFNYRFHLDSKDSKVVFEKSGEAVLSSFFFLATEIDDDSETGEGYASYEYWDKTADYWFAIRIGSDADRNGKHRARLNYGCKDEERPTMALTDCPTLRTE